MDLIIHKNINGFEIMEKSDFTHKLATGLKDIEEVGQFIRSAGGGMGAVKQDELLGRYREAWIPEAQC